MATAIIDRTAFIHIARFACAAVVAVAHLRGVAFPDYKEVLNPPLWFKLLAGVTGLAGDAVMFFFVISGWLVGGGLLRQRGKEHPYSDYAIARVARLWSVLIPLFAIQMVLSGQMDFKGAGCNLLGLQTVYCEAFGGNFPLWSLANETAYYFAFLLMVAALDKRFWIGLRVGFVIAALLYLAALSGPIRLYFAIWLIGCAASQVQVKPSAVRAGVAFAAFIGIVLVKRAFNLVNVFPADVVSSVALVATMVYLPESSRLSGARWPSALSSFSFSLYVTHIPAMAAFDFYQAGKAAVTLGELARFGLNAAGVFGAAIGFSVVFERQYPVVRQFLLTVFRQDRRRHVPT